MTEPIRDAPEQWPIRHRVTRYEGAIFSVVTDTVTMPDGSTADRDVVRAHGAVAVLPYDERADRVLLLRQYRHPVGMALWELPAGLRDVPGEPARATAERELYEEAHLRAGDWRLLVAPFSSPGMTDEKITIYLARDLSPAGGDQHVRVAEEAVMVPAWMPRPEAVAGVLTGRFANPDSVAGLLALEVTLARPGGLDLLRPA